MTHKQRVLELLSDGRPHSHMEGYRLGVMMHSRVADLRRDGYRIDCERDGDFYVYRLALDSGTGDGLLTDDSPGLPVSESSGRRPLTGAEGCAPVTASVPVSGAVQLSLTGPQFRKQAAA